jgi:hypothetical protein
MIKTIVGFLFLLVSFSSFADRINCLEKLLPYNRYSGLHQITREEWTDGGEILTADNAKTALRYLVFTKLLCKSSEVVIKVDPACSLTLQDMPQSNSSFAYTNRGYFIITRDSGRNTNFIFTKDRKFAD